MHKVSCVRDFLPSSIPQLTIGVAPNALSSGLRISSSVYVLPGVMPAWASASCVLIRKENGRTMYCAGGREEERERERGRDQ